MNLKPLGDRLIVEVLDEEDVTSSGIVLPDTAKEKPQRGRVLAVGPGSRDDSGKFVAIEQTFVRDDGSGGAVAPVQVNRVPDGSVAYSRTDGTMAAWAGAGAGFGATGGGASVCGPSCCCAESEIAKARPTARASESFVAALQVYFMGASVMATPMSRITGTNA